MLHASCVERRKLQNMQLFALLMGVLIDVLQKCGSSIITELQRIWRGIHRACDEHMQSGCEHPLSICTYQLCTCAFEIINRLLLHILCFFSAKAVKNMQNNNDLSLESLGNVWEAAGIFLLIQRVGGEITCSIMLPLDLNLLCPHLCFTLEFKKNNNKQKKKTDGYWLISTSDSM